MDRWLRDLDAPSGTGATRHGASRGHSFGASLALAYALRYPERVRSVIRLSGTGVDAAWHDQYRRNRLAPMTGSDRARFVQLPPSRH